MAVKIQIRRGTQTEWSTANPILMIGELGAETDTGRWKIGDGTTVWNSLQYGYDAKIPTKLITADKTLDISDIFTMQKCLSASAIKITIPNDSTFNFPIDSEIVITRYGSGTVSIMGEAGVTINSADAKISIDKQYQSIVLKKIASNEWLIIGALS